jgi:hypothetical protein
VLRDGSPALEAVSERLGVAAGLGVGSAGTSVGDATTNAGV